MFNEDLAKAFIPLRTSDLQSLDPLETQLLATTLNLETAQARSWTRNVKESNYRQRHFDDTCH